MIPTNTKAHETIGSLGGSQHAMGIDMSSLAHIMSVLTDLYSDPELAVIREYSTNARDSHIMAGVERPVEVSLPSPLRQTLEIRDFGLGLSVDEVVNVYGQYGASTKRGTNDANGMLGLGCKSALTYTSMFTVRAVKEGVLSEVAIFRDQNGAGSIEIIDTKATDEPNGVTVIIPTNSRSSFNAKAMAFYSVWPEGSVLVNDKAPERLVDAKHSFWMDSKTLIVSNDEPLVGDFANNNVVMGGVVYPVSDEFVGRSWYARYRAFYFADMGEVAFVPSREALNYTPEVKAVVKAFCKNVNDNVDKFAANDILAQTTIEDVLDKFAFYRRFDRYIAPNLEWNGHIINDRISDPDKTGFTYKRIHASRIGTGRKAVEDISVFSIDARGRYAFLNLDGKPLTPKRKEQFKVVVSNHSNENVWVLGPKPKHPFFTGNTEISLADLEKIVIPKAARKAIAVKKVPEYDFHHQGTYSYGNRTTMDTYKGKTIVPVTYTSGINRGLLRQDANLVYVVVPENRRNRFDSLYADKVISEKDYIKQVIARLPKFTESEILASANRGSHIRWFLDSVKGHQADQILDPRFKDILSVDTNALEIKQQAWYTVGKEIPSGRSLSKDYPLISYNEVKASIEYINLLFTHRKDA